MKLFNTLSRELEEFVPLRPGEVGLYTCGPTVYDYAHIGNFRAYVFEDILRRAFVREGYRVTQVMNLTDVDDKTIRGARRAGISLDAYTEPFKRSFFEDLETLRIERAEHYPAATGHIPEMIDLIGRLIDRGYAYRSEDGSVYFSIARFPGYGRLARLDTAGMKPGARVAHDEYEKENVADFALWKAWDEEDGDVVWDSPWGRGRPGWHIECSAMSMKYLGESFDVHTGGIDNAFPHHEDEIAQSEAATGKPFVRYWLHCAHLVVEGRKMSKSLGNFYTLRDILARGYTGREVRYVLLAGHYRQSLNFCFDALDAARAALARIDECRAKLERLAAGAGPGRAAAPEWAARAEAAFGASLADDLNVAEALRAVFELLHEGNRAMDAGDLTAEGAAGALAVLTGMDRVLAVMERPADEADAEVVALLEARQVARGRKDWAEADRIRREMESRGWMVQDTPAGPQLRKRA